MFSQRCLVLSLALTVVLAVTGCRQPFARGIFSRQATATPVARHVLQPMPSPTPWPTLTPSPLTPTSMPIGTAQPTTQASAPRKVTVTMTAAEINQYLSGESFSQEGASVKDLRVTITPQQMRIDGYVSQPSYGFAGDMTIYGRPQVVGAQLYFRVDSVKLGSQFSGFVRSIAENMILSKIQEKNGPNGIPIEAELLKDMTVTSVALGDGELLVEGLQR